MIQKKAVRVLAGLQYNESCKEHFVSLGIMTVVSLCIFETLLFVKNNLNLLKQDEISHLYETRGKHTFVRPQKHRTKFFEKSVSYSIIVELNYTTHFPLVLKN